MRSYFLLLGNVLHTLRDTGGREKRGIGHSRKKSQRGGDETECPVKGGRVARKPEDGIYSNKKDTAGNNPDSDKWALYKGSLCQRLSNKQAAPLTHQEIIGQQLQLVGTVSAPFW